MKVNSRQKAINTAKILFIEKGKDGVRMQEIADKAKINKGLLHYYFKSKESLFLEVFKTEFLSFYGSIFGILKENTDMETKLSSIIDHFFAKNESAENYASFMAFECGRNKKIVKKLETDVNFETSISLLNTEFKNNRISTSPEFALQVILNIVSLCSHPFSLKTMIDKVNGNKPWTQFIDERKAFLKTIIIGSLRP